jgi:DNA invertase Pin-like site-specific DNA recombinase
VNRDDYELLLTHAGQALRSAKSNLAVAVYDAKTLTNDAATDNLPETLIAEKLGVSRHTVRGWLGKPRKR